ncbi:MAG: hypothetical protein HYV45_03290, partial [Candidatus Moranbacteria bacterium]|nr:hypothetical protein [Candidatus Moranbacteria bacterium]
MLLLRTFSLFLLLFSSFFFLFPQNTQAALVPCGRSEDDTATAQIDESKPCTMCHIVVGGQGAIAYGLQIMTYIALAVIVAMAILYIVSSGNESTMKTAKGGIFAALIGVTIMLSAWLLVSTTLRILSATIPGLTIENGVFSFSCDTASNVGNTGGTENKATPGGEVTTPIVPGTPPSSFFPLINKAFALVTTGELIIFAERYEEFFETNTLDKSSLQVSLKGENGATLTLPLKDITSSSITYVLPQNISLGSYQVSLQTKEGAAISENTVDVKVGGAVATTGGGGGSGSGGGGDDTVFSGTCPELDSTFVMKDPVTGNVFEADDEYHYGEYVGPDSNLHNRIKVSGLGGVNYRKAIVIPFKVRESGKGTGEYAVSTDTGGGNFRMVLSDKPCARYNGGGYLAAGYAPTDGSMATIFFEIGEKEKGVQSNDSNNRAVLQYGKTYYFTIVREDRDNENNPCLTAKEDVVTGKNGGMRYCSTSALARLVWDGRAGKTNGGGGDDTVFSGTCPGYRTTIILKQENDKIWHTGKSRSLRYVRYRQNPNNIEVSQFDEMYDDAIIVVPFKVTDTKGIGRVSIYEHQAGQTGRVIVLSETPCYIPENLYSYVPEPEILAGGGSGSITGHITFYIGSETIPGRPPWHTHATLAPGKTYYIMMRNTGCPRDQMSSIGACYPGVDISWESENRDQRDEDDDEDDEDEKVETGTFTCPFYPGEDCMTNPVIKNQCCPNGTITACQGTPSGTSVTGTGCVVNARSSGRWGAPSCRDGGWGSVSDFTTFASYNKANPTGEKCTIKGDVSLYKQKVGSVCEAESAQSRCHASCCYVAKECT